MLKYILTTLFVFVTTFIIGQNNCRKNHRLFQFSKYGIARPAQHLGRSPQFRCLQGVTDQKEFITRLRNIDNEKYCRGLVPELDKVLKEIGFEKGIKTEFTEDQVKFQPIKYGTEGNLGQTRHVGEAKKKRYYHKYFFAKIVTKKDGQRRDAAAWKISNGDSCFIYIMSDCGNLFYPKYRPRKDSCCWNVEIKNKADPLKFECKSGSAYLPVKICYDIYKCYKVATRVKSGGKGKSIEGVIYRDSFPPAKSICKIDSILIDTASPKIFVARTIGNPTPIRVCKDTTIYNSCTIEGYTYYPADVPKDRDTFRLYIKDTLPCDTIPISEGSCPSCPETRWGVNLGLVYNSIPVVFDDNLNTKPSKGRLAAEISYAVISRANLQFGLSIGYLKLAYKDNAIYNGPPGQYVRHNELLLANPAIPIQVGVKFRNVCSRWMTELQASAGYALALNNKIINNGIGMNENTGTTGGFVSGVGGGLYYFLIPQCRFAIGLDIRGQYYRLNGNRQTYNLFAFPVMAGVRYRF